MTVSTIAAGIAIICAAALLELANKDYENEKKVFENS